MESNIMQDPQPMIQEARHQIYKQIEIIKKYEPYGLSIEGGQAIQMLREDLSKHLDKLSESQKTREGMTSWKLTLESVILRQFTTKVGGGGQGEISLEKDKLMIETVNKAIKSCLVYAQAILNYRDKQETFTKLITNALQNIFDSLGALRRYVNGISFETYKYSRSDEEQGKLFSVKRNIEEATRLFDSMWKMKTTIEILERLDYYLNPLMENYLNIAGETMDTLGNPEELNFIRSHLNSIKENIALVRSKTTNKKSHMLDLGLCMSNLPNQYFVQTTRRRHT
jgi:hypothetical protein